MLKYILVLAILFGGFLSQTANAQTPLLQALIDATPAGGTLTLPSDVVYPCNCVVRQAITIQSNGAKIITSNTQPAIAILPGVDDVTIKGVDISATSFVYDIVRIGETGSAQDTLDEVPTNITLDSISIHGAPDQDSQRGISANGANVRITNFRIYDIHGRGYDTQAIAAWNGPGPFYIADGYAEAAGENILFGGSDPSIFGLVPSDIQIRRVHCFKPLSWKVGDPSYAGFHWTVKNLLELKNARNVVIDGSVFENNWRDGQDGTAILFTVRNQDCTAPQSTIQNVTFTNNTVKNALGALNLLGVDNESITATSATCLLRSVPRPGSVRGSGLTINNNLFTDINGHFLVMNGFYNVAIYHNTPLQSGNTTLLYGEKSFGFILTDNITEENPYGIYGEGGLIGTAALEYWTPGYVCLRNVMAHPYGSNPPGNFYPASINFTFDYSAPDWPGVGVDKDALDAAQSGSAVPLPSPTPSATPTPTPTPSPTPTPLPSPSPTPTPTPSPSPSPRCRKVTPRGKCVQWTM
jgi:hypothetical protein